VSIQAPKKDENFRRYWNILIKDVENRDNFKLAHIKQLEVLVDLLLDYDLFTTFLREKGSSYESRTQYGVTYKKFPEVEMRQKTIASIKDYCKLLGITLTKDMQGKADPEASTWE